MQVVDHSLHWRFLELLSPIAIQIVFDLVHFYSNDFFISRILCSTLLLKLGSPNEHLSDSIIISFSSLCCPWNTIVFLASFYKLTSIINQNKLWVTKLTRKFDEWLNEWLCTVIIHDCYTCCWCRHTAIYYQQNFYCCSLMLHWMTHKYPPEFRKRQVL